MKNLFLSTILLFTPLILITASENNECVDKPLRVCQQFSYIDFGIGPLPFYLPVIKLGYRIQNHHHGMDFGIQGSSIYPYYSYVKGSVTYQYYFSPNVRSQYYLGFGTALGELFTHKYCQDSVIFPEFSIGKQFTTKEGGIRFLQMQINTLIGLWRDCDCSYHPNVTISYGIGF